MMKVPEGWKLVPVEPTPEMQDAYWIASTGSTTWKAMLAAAPTPPAEANVPRKPVAGEIGEAVEKSLRRAFNLGQTYWQQADSDSFSQQRKSDVTRQKFNDLVTETMGVVAVSRASVAPVSTPMFDEWSHLRKTGAWTNCVPLWAKDHNGLMNDTTAAVAVIAELSTALRASVAPVGSVQATSDFFAQVCDMIGIGNQAREPQIALANVSNALRRSGCLSEIENLFTFHVDVDDDEEECDHEQLLNWGQSRERYIETFKEALRDPRVKALSAVPAHPDDAAVEAEQAAPIATLHDDGNWSWNGPPSSMPTERGWRMAVYAAPQPAAQQSAALREQWDAVLCPMPHFPEAGESRARFVEGWNSCASAVRRLRSLESEAEEACALIPTCDVPPAGWSCSRQKGHAGPCAASPTTADGATPDGVRDGR